MDIKKEEEYPNYLNGKKETVIMNGIKDAITIFDDMYNIVKKRIIYFLLRL